jgi:hypothetical protein
MFLRVLAAVTVREAVQHRERGFYIWVLGEQPWSKYIRRPESMGVGSDSMDVHQ